MRTEYLLPEEDLNTGWTAVPTGDRFSTVDDGIVTIDLDNYIYATETEATQQFKLRAVTSQHVDSCLYVTVYFAYKGVVGTTDTPALTLSVYTDGVLFDSVTYNADTDGSIILSCHDFEGTGLTQTDLDGIDGYITYTPSGGEAYDKPVEISVLG